MQCSKCYSVNRVLDYDLSLLPFACKSTLCFPLYFIFHFEFFFYIWSQIDHYQYTYFYLLFSGLNRLLYKCNLSNAAKRFLTQLFSRILMTFLRFYLWSLHLLLNGLKHFSLAQLPPNKVIVGKCTLKAQWKVVLRQSVYKLFLLLHLVNVSN